MIQRWSEDEELRLACEVESGRTGKAFVNAFNKGPYQRSACAIERRLLRLVEVGLIEDSAYVQQLRETIRLSRGLDSNQRGLIGTRKVRNLYGERVCEAIKKVKPDAYTGQGKRLWKEAKAHSVWEKERTRLHANPKPKKQSRQEQLPLASEKKPVVKVKEPKAENRPLPSLKSEEKAELFAAILQDYMNAGASINADVLKTIDKLVQGAA